MTQHEPLVRDWLRGLMPLVQSNFSPDETRLRLNALAARLAANFPPQTFNDASFEAVSRRIKFFPSYAEVFEPLDAWQRERKPNFGMLLSDHSAYEPPPPPATHTDAERNHATRLVREVAAALRHSDVEKQAHYANQRSSWQRPPVEMTRAQLTEAYRQAGIRGPQPPKPDLRAAASTIKAETKRGPPVDA